MKKNIFLRAAYLFVALTFVTGSLMFARAKYTSFESLTRGPAIVVSGIAKQWGKHHLVPGTTNTPSVSVSDFVVTAGTNEGYYAFYVWGADGGKGGPGISGKGPGRGGYGGTVKGYIYLAAGTYKLVAGAVGSDGVGGHESYYHGGAGGIRHHNGGGGGGLSGIFSGSVAEGNEVVVAGGGGGSGGGRDNEHLGGNAADVDGVGGETPGRGSTVWNDTGEGTYQRGRGGGTSGNAGGKDGSREPGGAGSRLQGGKGSGCYSNNDNPGSGGGGGAGYNGGGGGGESDSASYCAGGGGGGSSYIRTSTDYGKLSALPAAVSAYVTNIYTQYNKTTNAAGTVMTSGIGDWTGTHTRFGDFITDVDGSGSNTRRSGGVILVYLGPNDPKNGKFYIPA